MSDRIWNTFLSTLRAGLWEQDLQLEQGLDVAGW